MALAPALSQVASVEPFVLEIEHKTRSLMALGWILLLAGIACTLHFTTLTALRELRQNNPAEVNWPSPWLAADWLAWDLFLGLSSTSFSHADSGHRRRADKQFIRIF